MAGGTDFGPQSPVSGSVAFCMAGNERGELAGTLPASSWKSAMLLQLLFSPKLTDRCEKSKGFNTEAPVGQDGIERWVMPPGHLHFQATVTAKNHSKMQALALWYSGASCKGSTHTYAN